MAQIDNRHVEYALTRNGDKINVFENGLGRTMGWWAKVFPEIAKYNTTFAYDRPGYGHSVDGRLYIVSDHTMSAMRTP